MTLTGIITGSGKLVEGCVDPECDGYMVDFHPRERDFARMTGSSGFNLIKIVCIRCGMTAWRIAGRNEGPIDEPRVTN